MFPTYRIAVRADNARASASPLVPLIDVLEQRLASAGNMAPDAETVLITFTADERAICEAEDAHSARISVRTLEFLWCIAHGFLTFYQNVAAGRAAQGQEVMLDAFPKTADALRSALKWALDCLVTGGPPSRWPPLLDAPDLASVDPTATLIRDVTCVAALTLLFHEVSHVERWNEAHSSLEDETRADADALGTITGSPALSSVPAGPLGLGLAVAFMLDLAPALWTGDYDGVIHPKSYHRLVAALPAAGDTAHNLLSAALPLLMEERWKGYRPPNYVFATPLEAVLYFSILLERVDEDRRSRLSALGAGAMGRP